ncbi:hypothetical protein C5167_012785 [Papaver somniferum]|uniref:Replication factor A C-terminal domain-containing protein n=1 Tax=Papaver somniferum TaxID=3469 RepID=A0A4Y7J2H4_PAPSO|nr:hypothetical protein C5167_012785 [Papaver somniferum]
MPPKSTRMQTYPKSLKCEKGAGAPMLDHPAILQYRLRKENYLYISILTTGKRYSSCSLPNGILPASKKVMGDDGDLWCTKCEAKVELPISRFMVRFEVEDHTGTTVFVALDSDVQNWSVLPQLSSQERQR